MNKSSAVAEMDDRARAKWAEKWGWAAVPLRPFRGGAGSPSNNTAWAEAYFRTKWYLDPSYGLATRH